MARKTPGLNTGAMSDISFLLLAFFLMVSNINTDMGIARKLPPPLPEDAEAPDVRERNIFVVLVSKDDRMLYNNEYGRIENLKDRAKEFLGNPSNDRSSIPVLWISAALTLAGAILAVMATRKKYGGDEALRESMQN